jgi:AcrR family transcriptional regulator
MTGEQPSERKPRAKRTSPEEVKRRVLDAAKSRIAEEGGLTLGFDHLPLESYIKAAEVPRSSVYRIWDSRAAFVADLIQDLFDDGDFTQGFSPSTRHAIEAVLRDHFTLVQGTAEQRHALMLEMVRVGVATNLEAADASEFRRSYWTLASGVPSIAPGLIRDAAIITVTRIEASFLTAMASFYETLLGLIGLRLRDPFTPRHIAVLTNSIVDAFTHRFELDRDIVETVFMGPGIDGEPAEWTYAAWSIASAIDGMTERYDEAPRAADQ